MWWGAGCGAASRDEGAASQELTEMRTAAPDPRPVRRVAPCSTLRTIEAAGVEFIPENGGGAGVRFSTPAQRRLIATYYS